MPRVSLRSFLATAKSTLRSASAVHQAAPVTFVVGNESADLDSICSALVLAYLRTYAPFSSVSTSPAKPRQLPPQLYIPLCNLWAPDLALRPELRLVLEQADLKPNDLITLSDVPFPTSSSHNAEPPFHPENTRWLLVDHNNLQSELGKLYSGKVTGCIDHHDDEGIIPDSQVKEVRAIRPCGSCCSLVIEHCQSAWQKLSSSQLRQQHQVEEDSKLWDSQLARVALAPILIDTANLKSKDKTTPADVAAVSFLKSIISSTADSAFSTDDYFHAITTVKEAIDDLSLPDILRKDYKQWSESTPKSESGMLEIGISSVVKDIQFLIDKEGSKEKFLNTVRDFARQRKLSVAGIMTTSHDEEGKFMRELFLWGFDEKGRETAAEFEGEGREKFGLKPWRDDELDLVDVKCWRKCWVQERVEFSRKKVAPTLRGAVARI